jgi:hypothetical protein
MDNGMSRNEEDESPQRRVEEDQPLKEADEIGERDTMKLPVHPPDTSRPAERPDLEWAEHED